MELDTGFCSPGVCRRLVPLKLLVRFRYWKCPTSRESGPGVTFSEVVSHRSMYFNPYMVHQ